MDNNIIQDLKRGDKKVMMTIYNDSYKSIVRMVIQNSGDEEDAKDVFQDAMVIIYEKIRSDELRLSSSFSTYLFSICRNLWLQELTKRKKWITKEEYEFNITEEFIDIKEELLENQKQWLKEKLYHDSFLKLKKECQDIIKLSLTKNSALDIAKKMGFKSEAYARNRKSHCKKALFNYIKEDNRYKEIIEVQ